MPIHGPRGGFLSTSDYDDLEKLVQRGDGLGWSGDPLMDVRIGIVTEQPTGRQGHRIEIWRNNEDGSESLVQHFHPSERGFVCYELARSRTDSPGYVPVEDRIDAHNKQLEDKASRQYQDVMGTAMDHALRLNHEREFGKTKFYGLDGFREKMEANADKTSVSPNADSAPAAD